jgi:hypothetical protein
MVILRTGGHLLNEISQDPRFRPPERLDLKDGFRKRIASMQSRSGPWLWGRRYVKPFAIQSPNLANVTQRLGGHPDVVDHPLFHVRTVGAQVLQIDIVLDKPPSNGDGIVSVRDGRFVDHAVILATFIGTGRVVWERPHRLNAFLIPAEEGERHKQGHECHRGHG